MSVDLSKLKDKFHPDAIEWRVQQSGKKGDKGWAMVLAYITNRAIMERLDEACGPANWKNDYREAPNGGILCGISIKIDGEWVTKWDGAENTDIEAVKGGLSNAMKRAAVQWGIGRYLYKLEATFVQVNSKGKYRIFDKKSGVQGFWDPPKLPSWALPVDPEVAKRKAEEKARREAEAAKAAAEAEAAAKAKGLKAVQARAKEMGFDTSDKHGAFYGWLGQLDDVATDENGVPSLSRCTADQLRGIYAALPSAKKAIEDAEAAKSANGVQVSESTRQAATANGVIDPTKFDPEPEKATEWVSLDQKNEWASLGQKEFAYRLRLAIHKRDVRLHAVLADAIIDHNKQTVRFRYPAEYTWAADKTREGADLITEITGMDVVVEITQEEKVEA